MTRATLVALALAALAAGCLRPENACASTVPDPLDVRDLSFSPDRPALGERVRVTGAVLANWGDTRNVTLAVAAPSGVDVLAWDAALGDVAKGATAPFEAALVVRAAGIHLVTFEFAGRLADPPAAGTERVGGRAEVHTFAEEGGRVRFFLDALPPGGCFPP